MRPLSRIREVRLTPDKKGGTVLSRIPLGAGRIDLSGIEMNVDKSASLLVVTPVSLAGNRVVIVSPLALSLIGLLGVGLLLLGGLQP